MKTFYNLKETIELIEKGIPLAIAGDESLLKELPKGQWLGGTIPYFMDDEGGVKSTDRLQVTIFPDFVKFVDIKMYSVETLSQIPQDYPKNGFSFVLLPCGSDAHLKYSESCMSWKGFFDRPIVGWITGVDLEEIGKKSARVFNGMTLESSSENAFVMHLSIPEDKFAQINIVNLFEQGGAEEFEFLDDGFEIEHCLINNTKFNFFDYIAKRSIDIKLPLVADFNGAMINVSIQSLDEQKKHVTTYAPVFKGIKYRFARPVGNYAELFAQEVNKHKVEPAFSCNCILNYVYAELEGKKTGAIKGPMTFGEIAYILLNQTMVYLTFENKVP